MSVLFISIVIMVGCLKEPSPKEVLPTPPVIKQKSKKIGLRGERVPEGFLVTRVRHQSSADAVGISAGDLITQVDGKPVFDGKENRMVWGMKDAVSLTVRKPFSVPSVLTVYRGKSGKRSPAKDWSPEYRALRKKMAKGTIEELTQALARMKDPNPDELALAIRLLSKRRYDAFPELLTVFSTINVEKAAYWSLVGAHFAKLKKWKQADAAYDRFYNQKVPDVKMKTRSEDLLLPLSAAELSIEAAWRSGKRKKAKKRLARLDMLGDSNGLREKLGLKPVQTINPWRAVLAPAPDIDVTLLDGTPWRLQNKKDGPVVINFWASWCGPCKKELPALDQLALTYRDQPVSFLALSADDADLRPAVEQKIADLKVKLPVAHAPDVAQAYGISSLPAIRLLDQNGAIQYFSRGFSKRSIPALKEQIDLLLSGHVSGADLGHFVGRQPAKLSFYPIPNIVGAQATSKGLMVSIEGLPPQLVDSVSDALELDMNTAGAWPAGNLLAELPEGSVSCSIDGWMCRAFDTEGDSIWTVNFDSKVVDLLSTAENVFIATQKTLYRLNANGLVLGSVPVRVRDLNAINGKPVGLVDDRLVEFNAVEGGIELVPIQAVDARFNQIDNQGRLYGDEVSQAMTISMGSALLRKKGGVVVLNHRNQPIGSFVSEFPLRLFRHDAPSGDLVFGVVFVGRGLGVIDFGSR